MKNYFYTALAILGLLFYPMPSQTPGMVKNIAFDKATKIAQAASAETIIPKTIIYKVWVTAYSSTLEETDSTPFITARNTPVRDGIVAVNFLPFGTKVRIPSLFGEKVFTVEDRMHSRKKNFVDIWMPSKQLARNFGIFHTDIEVVN